MTAAIPADRATAPAAAANPGAGRTSGERAVPYHCPFCAEEDLRPHGTTHGAWHCRSCLRVFSVRFLGLEGLEVPDDATAAPTSRSLSLDDTTGGTP